jgi:Tol biopolymer transport system component
VPSGAEAQIPVDELPQNPVWLPDGSAISFTSGEGNLFLVRSDGAGLRQVTDSGDTCSDVHHAWSPDGSQVAFGRDCTSGGRPGLYVADANGRWAVRVVNKHEAIQGISWSPDGARIAFAPWPQETPGIFSVRPDGSDLLQLTTDLDVQPTWSPDGDEIAFVRDGRIWIMSADGRFSSPIAALRGLHVQALAWTGR